MTMHLQLPPFTVVVVVVVVVVAAAAAAAVLSSPIMPVCNNYAKVNHRLQKFRTSVLCMRQEYNNKSALLEDCCVSKQVRHKKPTAFAH